MIVGLRPADEMKVLDIVQSAICRRISWFIACLFAHAGISAITICFSQAGENLEDHRLLYPCEL